MSSGSSSESTSTGDTKCQVSQPGPSRLKLTGPSNWREGSSTRGRGAASALTPAEAADDNETGSVYIFIDPESLVKTKKSADSDYFFGRRAIDKGFKCRLCPSVFSLFEVDNILSPSTGKNMEPDQDLPPAAFIFRILKATWKRTLLQFRNTGLRTSYRKSCNSRQTTNVSLMCKECHSLWRHSGSNWSKFSCPTTSYVYFTAVFPL